MSEFYYQNRADSSDYLLVSAGFSGMRVETGREHSEDWWAVRVDRDGAEALRDWLNEWMGQYDTLNGAHPSGVLGLPTATDNR